MLFFYKNKWYSAETAVQIVEQVRRDTPEYRPAGYEDSVKLFLLWSLGRLADRIPLRELDVSENLPDETVSFNYLCLLDSYDGATLCESHGTPAP